LDAITYNFANRQLETREIDQPNITADDQLLIKVLQVGICGTDRAIIRGETGQAPSGLDYLVLGHEMLGQVVTIGDSVKEFSEGDYVVCTVRRGCGECVACEHGESDLCFTGRYTERGINKAHGYMTRYVVEHKSYCVKVDPDLIDVAVLTEPLSIVEKAILEAVSIQHRLDWIKGKSFEEDWKFLHRALIAGAGPIGILACMVLRLHNIETHVIDVQPHSSLKAKIVEEMGATYHDTRGKDVKTLRETLGNIDIIVEATGVAPLAWDLLNLLGPNGILVFTGVPGDRGGDFTFDSGHLMRQMVMENQIILGSVNANRTYFEKALDDLKIVKTTMPNALNRIITSRHKPEAYDKALKSQMPDQIKEIIVFA